MSVRFGRLGSQRAVRFGQRGPLAFHSAAAGRGFSATTDVPALTGAQPGDVLLAFAAGNDLTVSLTPPLDVAWTLIGDTVGADPGRLRVFAATASSADQVGGTWTWGGTHNHSVAIVAYGGALLPSTAAMVRAGASATTVDAPSVTASRSGSLLVTYAMFVSNGTAPAWPVSMTVRLPAQATSDSGVAAEELLTVGGASGVRTFAAGGTPAALTAASVLLE